MEQNSNYATAKDAQIVLSKEECAGGMGLSVSQLCSTEGFTNQSKLGVGGVSIRHGSKGRANDAVV